jgi:hypothetical protein
MLSQFPPVYPKFVSLFSDINGISGRKVLYFTRFSARIAITTTM